MEDYFICNNPINEPITLKRRRSPFFARLIPKIDLDNMTKIGYFKNDAPFFINTSAFATCKMA